ncbi:YdiU family protein [Pseudoxanthomonas sp. GW2]|uniref:protein adenylyltransferase SelO n=1 Tax=Pseudoxanthomonas sp. GW2 TaxID=1211114 RepID=UPI0002F762D5|nr:YdiU family protein [Pseudoxanthomonas sp. GW2]
MRIGFDNSFLRELPGDPEAGPRVREVFAAWSRVDPTPVAAPRLLAWSPEAAALAGLDAADAEHPDFARVFGGNALLEGMQPWAANYGGHQFGSWAGQLGDGRAISLGEAIGPDGGRWELQLKGAGRTPYSRFGDGRAVLRSSIREFLCSEAMHHLGIPTTRALSLVGTGEEVVRDMFYDGHPRPEPGAVVCRMAPSFLRFGSWQLPASRGDTALLRRLADHVQRHHFPDLHGLGPAGDAEWFAQVCERTAWMVAGWMRVGFVHGVMNTDNMSILGLTIDYGPYGWLEDYDPDWTPNTTDAHGRRYRYGAQPQVAYWNLTRLAQALAPLFGAAAPLEAGLQRYLDAWARAEREMVAGKLGLARAGAGDVALFEDLCRVLQAGQFDLTTFFRQLGEVDPATARPADFAAVSYDAVAAAAVSPALQEWLARYAARLADDPLAPPRRRERMRLANPRYVLRNWLAQEAIDRAEAGDLASVATLLEVMRRPYEDQPGREHYAGLRPEWARHRAGCSMLSCSS